MIERNPRALAYTLRVVLAAATAREDLRAQAVARRPDFQFRLLAAATRELPRPPAQGWYDAGRQLKVTVLERGEELRLSFQAEGFEALQRVAGRTGRLKNRDGTIDVGFQFDQAGKAFVVLQASSDIARALLEFELLLEPLDGRR
jgi:hypothetical protein